MQHRSIDHPDLGSHIPDRSCWLGILRGREIYHAAPLHYLPSIFNRRTLLSARVGISEGIAPRKSAARRDRMLDVDRFVHLSFDLFTPLLTDKLTRGMAHAVVAFRADAVAACCTHALQPYNTKAWRSKATYAPVTDPVEMISILRRRDEFGRYPSLEFLVEGVLPLALATRLIFFSAADRDLMVGALKGARVATPIVDVVAPRGTCAFAPHPDMTSYLLGCATRVADPLRPPNLPFD